MKHTRQELDIAIQTYADAFKSGNPNLMRFAAATLQAIVSTLPESWEVPDPAKSAAKAEGGDA